MVIVEDNVGAMKAAVVVALEKAVKVPSMRKFILGSQVNLLLPPCGLFFAWVYV